VQFEYNCCVWEWW